ncbi:MAG: hypothetical protein AAGE94_10325 [Acidobacteriota bacterium]
MFRFAPVIIRVVALSALVLASPLAAEGFVEAVERAHGEASWDRQQVLQADIVVEFRGNTMIDGTMWTDTPVGKTRFELADGTVLIFDGDTAWTSPADAAFQGTRFHVLTWPYFLAAPMKLDDPGTHVETLGDRPFAEGRALPAAKLTFDAGVGDSPEDWYVLYRDPATDHLVGMAYIVTFGTAVEKAEEEPHAIVYSDPVEVDGVTLFQRWVFHDWSAEKGIFGDPIGRVELSNLRFVEPAANAFERPADAREEAAPGS